MTEQISERERVKRAKIKKDSFITLIQNFHKCSRKEAEQRYIDEYQSRPIFERREKRDGYTKKWDLMKGKKKIESPDKKQKAEGKIFPKLELPKKKKKESKLEKQLSNRLKKKRYHRTNWFSLWRVDRKKDTSEYSKYEQRIDRYMKNHPHATFNEARGHKEREK